MKKPSICRLAWFALIFPLISACGGGDDSGAAIDPATVGANSAAKQSSFISDYSDGLKTLSNYAGLTSAAFLDLFDVSFVDGGLTKAMVSANLAQEAAAAVAVSPDLPTFPLATLSGATIGGCDSSNVCTLSGTLSNNDVDASAANTTSVAFTTRVKYSDGKFRLLGDGAAS